MEKGWYIIRFYPSGVKEITRGPFAKAVEAQIEVDKISLSDGYYHDCIWCDVWPHLYQMELQTQLYEILKSMVDDIDDEAEISTAMELLRTAARRS